MEKILYSVTTFSLFSQVTEQIETNLGRNVIALPCNSCLIPIFLEKFYIITEEKNMVHKAIKRSDAKLKGGQRVKSHPDHMTEDVT